MDGFSRNRLAYDWLIEKIAENRMSFPKNALNLYPENLNSKKKLNKSSSLEFFKMGISYAAYALSDRP